MERKDLIQKNGEIFKEQGIALEKYAKPTVKVCVIGNPCNTMALVCALNAPKVPIENFTAITRLDQNRAAMQVAKKIGTNFKNVSNVIIWGNHSSTMFPDLTHAWIENYPENGNSEAVIGLINDESWIANQFLPTVQKRGGTIIALRGNGAAASTAKAICDHMHDWIVGTPDGKVVSMAVISNQNTYGVEDGLIFSFPVTSKDGQWKIVSDYKIDESASEMIRITENELLEERNAALSSEDGKQKEIFPRLESQSTEAQTIST